MAGHGSAAVVTAKGRLDHFVAPRPRRWVMGATASLNRVLTLRRLAGIRELDFPSADEARLRAVCGAGRATFIAPNHPEFFTDWMIDKEILSRASPMAAAWATNAVVNGMGALAQRFWLANNLIAQIPGRADAARSHSVEWAVAGQGVLLHPEGAVGWHGDWIAPLLPGTAEMAIAALDAGRRKDPHFAAWIAPVVWKLLFIDDADQALHGECAYVEQALAMAPALGLTVAERVYAIYETLLARDELALGISTDRAGHLVPRLERATDIGIQRLRRYVHDAQEIAPGDTLRAARRWLRSQQAGAPHAAEVRDLADRLQRMMRLGPFAWRRSTMTQENAAEHLKRIRSDYLVTRAPDRRHKLVPRPVAPRRAVVRVPEPVGIERPEASPLELTGILRGRLQAELDRLNAEFRDGTAARAYENPFYA